MVMYAAITFRTLERSTEYLVEQSSIEVLEYLISTTPKDLEEEEFTIRTPEDLERLHFLKILNYDEAIPNEEVSIALRESPWSTEKKWIETTNSKGVKTWKKLDL